MIIYRIKFKNIISELMIPETPNGTAIVFLPGLPSKPGANKVTEHLFNNGYTIFQPFYSGSFDSSGDFTPTNCIKDVKTFLTMAKQKQFREFYYDKLIKTETKQIVLIGTSFGTSIAIAANPKNIYKMILLSPILVYDQDIINKLDIKFDFLSQMIGLLSLLKNTFPFSYRIRNFNVWTKFLFKDSVKGSAYHNLNKISVPTLLVHGNKDKSLPYQLTETVLAQTKNTHLKLESPLVGHSLSTYDTKTLDKISKFIYD